MTRADIHRPSEINPTDYEYVGIEHEKVDAFNYGMIAEMKERIQEHMKGTGGTYSKHKHGGNCHVCGAHCIYTVLFYHAKSNTYIRTGNDCANKLEMASHNGEFDTFKIALKRGLDFQKGKQRAEAYLKGINLNGAWELYNDNLENYPYEERTICDIVDKLIKYGELSEKQENYLGTLLYKVEHREEIEQKQAEEKENALPCPEGRAEIQGTLLKTKIQESMYGETLKMLVKDDRGFLVWGTVPRSLNLQDLDRDKDKVKFTATISQSKDDAKFGFFKRPIKAEILKERNN